ncbi:MAG: nucleotide pyrophosphohydrolase [Firmicutes bacterium]|nr:nucleotide pyrophosphohydrolase [Bacillota bacterium]MCL1953855.1 nucleotide pyrophosphohydrolase [Bacillota bacterium]
MNDNTTTISQLAKSVYDFVMERDWHVFHTAKDIAMDISVEANELLEIFLWQPESNQAELLNNPVKLEHIKDELADVLVGILDFATTYNIDLTTVLNNKLKKNAIKYPIEKAKGNNKKYNEF